MSDTPVAIRGERSLWAAVIQTAIEDARGNVRGLSGPTARAESRRARIWLTTPNKDFNEVCHLAGLDPVAVRERCQRMFPNWQVEPDEQPKPRHRPRQAQQQQAMGLSLTRQEWAERLGVSIHTLNKRICNTGSLEAAISMGGLKRRGWRKQQPGVVTDLPAPKGTGAGSVAQDIPQIEFSE